METGKNEMFLHRVTQLDAYVFDRDIHSLLMNNISEIGKCFGPGFLSQFMPEIDLLVKLVTFKYSVLQNNSTFGQQFLNAQYHRKLNKKDAVLFSLLNYFIPYLKQKYDNASLKWNNNKVKKVIDRLELFIKACQFINLLVFLKNGVFPTLTDRIMRIKTVPTVQKPRTVGYKYMTRELLWHGFMEFFMYVLPLIDYNYIKRKFLNFSPSKSIQQQTFQNISPKDVTDCSICGEKPIYPCRISLYCKHVACYYCIKSNTTQNNIYFCPSCGVKSTADSNLQFINFKSKNEKP